MRTLPSGRRSCRLGRVESGLGRRERVGGVEKKIVLGVSLCGNELCVLVFLLMDFYAALDRFVLKRKGPRALAALSNY